MPIAAIPGDVMTIAAALFLLFGVPALLFGVIMLYTGYVRYDADRYLEELEEEAGTAGGREAQDGTDEERKAKTDTAAELADEADDLEHTDNET